MSRRFLIPAAAALLALGCDGDDEIGRGTVVGRVESTTQPFAARAPVAFVLQQVGSSAAAKTAVVGQFDSDGDLNVLADADVDANARFRVTGVPASRARLVAEVRDDAGDAVGRSIVHIGPDEGGVVPVAAINGETTAEANVFAELRSRGIPSSSIATPEITAKLEFASDIDARTAATSDAEIEALADAFDAALEAFLDALSRLEGDVDANDLQAAGADAALLFAGLRDEGTSEDEAEQTFLSALAEGYADAGLSLDAQSQAGSAATAAGIAATGDADAELTLLRGAATQMAAARELLAIAALIELGGSQSSAQAIANARIELDAEVSAATNVDQVLDAFDAFQAVILDELAEVVDAQLGIGGGTFLGIVLNVAGGSFQADLVTALAAATDTDDIVTAYLDFYEALRAVVVGALTALGVAEVDAELVADVFVAADAGLEAIF